MQLYIRDSACMCMYPVAYVSNKDSAGIVVETRSAPSRTVQVSHGQLSCMHPKFADLTDFNVTQLIVPFGLLEYKLLVFFANLKL